MPEEKEYGYARDLADIADPGSIPTEVTGNAINALLSDHPNELEPGDELDDGAIKNHDYILLTNSPRIQVVIKEQLGEFDTDLRDDAAAASGSIENQTSPTIEPTDPSGR